MSAAKHSQQPSRPRVLFAHDSGRFEGGASHVLAALARGLDGRADCAAALGSDGDLAELLRQRGLEVAVIREARINSTGHFPLRATPAAARSAARYALARRHAEAALTRLIARLRPDVVHVFTSSLPWAGGVARRLAVPFILHLHDFPHGRAGAAVLARSARGAKRVLAVSPAVARASQPYLQATPMEVVPNPVDPCRLAIQHDREDVRAELGLDAQVPVVAFAGQLIPAKGTRLLIPIMHAVTKQLPGCVLLVVGRTEPPLPIRGPTRHLHELGRALGLLTRREDERLRRAARRRPVSRVVMAGFREDVPDLLAASDAVLLPNQAPEPFGLVAAEARALGIPTVVADVEGLGDRLRGDEGCSLVAPGDVPGFAAALIRTLRTPPPRRPRGGRSPEEVATQLLRVYQGLPPAGAEAGSSPPARRS